MKKEYKAPQLLRKTFSQTGSIAADGASRDNEGELDWND